MKDKSLTKKKTAKKLCADAAKKTKQRLEHKKNLLKSLKMPQSTAKVSFFNNSNGDANLLKDNSSVTAANAVSLNKANDVANISTDNNSKVVEVANVSQDNCSKKIIYG